MYNVLVKIWIYIDKICTCRYTQYGFHSINNVEITGHETFTKKCIFVKEMTMISLHFSHFTNTCHSKLKFQYFTLNYVLTLGQALCGRYLSHRGHESLSEVVIFLITDVLIMVTDVPINTENKTT